MSGEGSMRNTLVPLVLRVALGIIFVYHGLQKVTDRNAWGAAWAANFWHDQTRMPADVGAKLEAVEQDAKRRQAGREEKAKGEDKEKAKEGAEKKEEEARLTPMQVAAVRDYLAEKYALETGRGVPEGLRWYAVQLAVAWGELIGGLALLLGLLTRAAAAGLILIQLGAIYTVTYALGFSLAGGGGYEYNLALIAMCLALVLGGAGLLSVDSLTRSKSAGHPHHSPAGPTEPATAARF